MPAVERWTTRSGPHIRYLDNAPDQPAGLPILFSPGLSDTADEYLEFVPGGSAPDGPRPASNVPPGALGPGPGRGRRPALLAIAGVATTAGLVAAVLALTGSGSGGSGPTPTTGGPATTAGSPEAAEVCLDEGCTAEARFEPSEQVVVACDNAEDGLSAVAVVSRSDQAGESTVWASRGNGTCTDEGVDIPAGTTVALKACTGDRPTGEIDRCSDAVEGTA